MRAMRICNLLFLIYQIVCSCYDIRGGTVPRWLLITGSAMAAAVRVAGVGEGTWAYVYGGLLGTAFLLVSRNTKEALGYADSWMIFVLGLYMGIWRLAASLGIAFFTAGIWAMGMVVMKKKGRSETFPFLPFLTAGYLGGVRW